jgi:hypothetical protein
MDISENITIKLSGHWLQLWMLLQNSEPKLSRGELLRQAIAMRAAASAVGSDGKKPEVLIRFKNGAGEIVTEDLKKHIGMKGRNKVKQ